MEENIDYLKITGATEVTNKDYRGDDRMFHLTNSDENTNLFIRVFPGGEIEICDGRSIKHIHYSKKHPDMGLMMTLSNYRGNLDIDYDTLDK